MIWMDRLADDSRLKGLSPAIKGVLSMFTLLLCLGVDSTPFSLLVLLIGTISCTAGAGLSVKYYVKLLCIPFWFILIGALAVAVNITPQPAGFFSLPVLGYYLCISKAAIWQAAGLFLKSLACVSCVYFFYVSTPMPQVFGLLQRMHLPAILIEMMMMIYRFIFILLRIAEDMSISQKSRLGNQTFGSSFRSLSILASSVFVKALQKSTDVLNAMESRGYDGAIRYNTGLQKSLPQYWAVTAGYCMFLVLLVLLIKGLGG